MSIAVKLLGFGLRQLFDGAEPVLKALQRHGTDHTQTLPRALNRANDRAWQALRLVLAGAGLLDTVRDVFRDADLKAVRQDIRTFLDTQPTWQHLEQSFRKACLAEIEAARKQGALSAESVPAQAIAEQARQFERYTDLAGMTVGAGQVMSLLADELRAMYPRLAQLLTLPTGGPPLLVSAFTFFLRREIGTNQELANEMTWDSLQRLCAAQEAALNKLDSVLHLLGPRLDQLLAGQQRIEEGVLNLQETLERLGQDQSQQADEVRLLLRDVLRLLDQAHMERGEVRPPDSFSIRGASERQAVKQLLQRFRQLSPEEQARFPELLNGLGKLQFGSGDNVAAEQTFEEVAELVDSPRARAEAHYNAYRAALEAKDCDEAFRHIVQAAQLDPQRFAPFPLHTYEPQKILGAGGFGTAFLCFHRRLKKQRVVKAIHSTDLDRTLETVFEEATLLQELRNPAIIEVYECNYADPDSEARPYLVMEYFAGLSLGDHLAQHGPLFEVDLRQLGGQLATAMQAAHSKGILHRDLKPDNVLVRKVDGQWEIKIIDFGLALRRSTIETSAVSGALRQTMLGQSVAGTLDYAPPEQLGKLLGVPPGPYSDVYAFGKLCCYALFQTTEPKKRHWSTISEPLADLLESCTEADLKFRVPDFARVLEMLTGEQQQSPQEREPQQKPTTAEDYSVLQQIPMIQPAPTVLGPASPKPAPAIVAPADAEPEKILFTCTQCDKQLVAEAELASRQVRCPYCQSAVTVPPLIRGRRGRANRPELLSSPLATTQARDYQQRWADFLGIPTANALMIGKQKAPSMRFAWIPPGAFLMGGDKYDAEKPVHRVTLTKGFYLAIFPVTQAQWQGVMGYNPSHFRGEERPVEMVSWEDCQEFCQKLRELTDKPIRLPTEAEWEYACRAGTTTEYCNGNGEEALKKVGWYDGNNNQQTRPVGQLAANAWGLYDMHGNVWEWCADWYGTYPKESIKDPLGVNKGDARVLRGGSWNDDAEYCRAAYRGWYAPGNRFHNFGCRVCFSLD